MKNPDLAGEREPTESTLDAFDVVDVLGGFCVLERRSPTLGGSVPLRVAQACVPLLEGNAFGFQVVLKRRIELRRKLGRWTASSWAGESEVQRVLRASIPMAVAQGLLAPNGDWRKLLEQGVVSMSVSPIALRQRAPIALFTGLFVRPKPGIRLRQSSTKNRRSLAYHVREAILDAADAWTPLVLQLDPTSDAFALIDEIATIAALPARAVFRLRSLEEAPDVAAAHLAFYDRAYFDTKKRGDMARKYRRETSRVHDTRSFDESQETIVELVAAGPLDVDQGRPKIFHRGHGPVIAQSDAPIDRLIVRNAVALGATFDGIDVHVEPDRDALRAFAGNVRSTWQPTFARAGENAHEGALLYLTKYVTPHPPGEPHFFVKPSALFRTTSGTSMLLEGGSADGYEILRGVVQTDSFHAAPAVFQLTQPGRKIVVGQGAPLMELFPLGMAHRGRCPRRRGAGRRRHRGKCARACG